MAAPTIDNTFISQFESEVHVAFQRMGSKLRNTVREKKVSAQDDTFPKIGKGVAGQKARHGKVPLMNLDHSKVKVSMDDYYTGELIDKLDMLKTNIDERQVTVQAIAGALGRKVDEVLTTTMDSATTGTSESPQGADNVVVHGSTGLTKAKIQGVHQRFGDRDVPDDGQRYWPVSPAGWVDLIDIQEFSDADYIGPDQLPWPTGITAKRWFGFLWWSFSGLPISGSTRKSFCYHRSAIGLGMNAEPQITPSYENEYAAFLFVGSLALGSVIIDQDGLEEVQYTE
ncbi:MAG: hypothetical protein CMG35_11205 [Candidatus Marinimicrobia bacterium]|nr:hypothetical protein [Candidatus Neomarinimicrobiota bacterium]|tara:strand:+ start:5437 stop:6288 length:852 start_codon:yes stop_codon:yes gene_type:complete